MKAILEVLEAHPELDVLIGRDSRGGYGAHLVELDQGDITNWYVFARRSTAEDALAALATAANTLLEAA